MKFFQHRQAPAMVLQVLALSLIAVSPAACGAQQQAAGNATLTFSHVFTILLENKEYTTIIGKSYAPYLNSLVSIYGLATQYYAMGHPGLPNYMALTGGSTFGMSSDSPPAFSMPRILQIR